MVDEPLTPPASDAEADDARQLRHELRTPVNHIVGYGQLLLEDVDGSDADLFTPHLEAICADGQRVLVLVDGIVDRTAADAGALATLAAGIAERCATMQRSAAEHGRAGMIPDLQRIEGAAQRLAALVAARLAASPSAPEQQPAAADEGPAAVLVVDDNEMNRDMLSRRLERLGYRVLFAENGREALDRLRDEPVDVVLLDLMMPEMDGYAVLAERQQDARLRDIPVIMITAVDEVESVVRCIELGAEDYLTKPFNPVLLKARVGACVEKKRRRDQEAAYLRDVARLTEAATAVEQRSFRLESLAAVAARPDELGQLARVFQRMAGDVEAREERLRAELRARGYVFLSYASADRERALALVAHLESAGVRVWVDRHDIAGGTNWGAEIVQSIRGCAALLVACSQAAMQSRNVRQEIQLAWKYGRPYVPVLLERTEFPDEIEYQLEGWQWVEILDAPSEAWLPTLLVALERLGLETSPPGVAGAIASPHA